MSLAGDASDRSYYRVQLEKGSLVLALLTGPFSPEALPFLNVARLFGEIPVRVPRIEHVSGSEGILALEDLGDHLLQHAVSAASPSLKRELYREAIAIMARVFDKLDSGGIELST